MKLAEEQGVKPMTLETLKAMARVWPEDESIDDFIAAVQEWRSEGGERLALIQLPEAPFGSPLMKSKENLWNRSLPNTSTAMRSFK